MSLLTACQKAAIELNQTEPSAIFASTDQFARELKVQANKSAEAIMKAYDWQKLITRATVTGDGATTSFTLPTDYDRMVQDSNLASNNSNLYPSKAKDLNQWDYFQNHPAPAVPIWILFGGAMQFNPAPASGTIYSYFYVSKNVVSGGKPAFTADADELVLPERLLTLSIIWRWRAAKRMEYAEDMRNYEIALAEEVKSDKGNRILTVGRQRIPANVRTAYPGPLGP